MNSVQHTAGHSENPAPRVSVIIPAHNTAPFIAETLDSVFGQTFRDFEVIVINDGSPDSAALEVALQPYRSRVQYIRQENRGLPGARNVGIGLARGELLAFVDSDDIWMPDYLSAQVEFLDRHPGVHACIADALLFGSCGEEVWRMLKEGTGPVLTFEQMLKREGGQLPSALVARRGRVLQVGMFDEQLRIGEDVEFCVRLCFPDGTIGYLGRVLVKYRQRPGSLTSDPGKRKWRVAEVEALHALRQKLPLTEAQRTLLDDEIAASDAAVALSDAFDHLSANRFQQGERCLAEANAYFRDPRITLTRFGLKAFPRWTARVASWRRKRVGR
jgi:glycosyltransferase involved in cell wall biosynthesis